MTRPFDSANFGFDLPEAPAGTTDSSPSWSIWRTESVPRLRVGIGAASGVLIDHVLGKFEISELPASWKPA